MSGNAHRQGGQFRGRYLRLAASQCVHQRRPGCAHFPPRKRNANPTARGTNMIPVLFTTTSCPSANLIRRTPPRIWRQRRGSRNPRLRRKSVEEGRCSNSLSPEKGRFSQSLPRTPGGQRYDRGPNASRHNGPDAAPQLAPSATRFPRGVDGKVGAMNEDALPKRE